MNYLSLMDDYDSKKVLWDNVSALMDARYGKANLTKFATETGIGPGTMTRIKEQKTSVGIDVLEKIASKFKIEPWKLLAEKFNSGSDAKRIISNLSMQKAVTLGECLEGLSHHLEAMDPDTRRKAMLLITDLERAPKTHAVVTAMIELSIASEVRKRA